MKIAQVVPLGNGLVCVYMDDGSSSVVRDDGSFADWTGESDNG